MKHSFLEYYRCPEENVRLVLQGALSSATGFFQFGPGLTCYGRCTSGNVARQPRQKLNDASNSACSVDDCVQLPFDLTEIVTNLRLERYRRSSNGLARMTGESLRDVYYGLRPFTPSSLRIMAQRTYLRRRESIRFPRWPVDLTVDYMFQKVLQLQLQCTPEKRFPFIWFWPDGRSACAVMTHDVESRAGMEFCRRLMDIDESWGIKSSFQIVPEKRYRVPSSLLREMKRRRFEVNIHDLNHDGRLFRDRERFLARARKINEYAKMYGAAGFRAGSMYRQPAWFDDLEIAYDMSIPASAHMEPQRGGCCTVMPFFIGNVLEIPLTTTQDWAIFYVLREHSTRLWKRQMKAIGDVHGMSCFITHPDYLIPKEHRVIYSKLLSMLADSRSSGNVWLALPGEVNRWWRQRAQMALVYEQNQWRVTGEGSERARVAFAKLVDGKICYVIEPPVIRPDRDGKRIGKKPSSAGEVTAAAL